MGHSKRSSAVRTDDTARRVISRENLRITFENLVELLVSEKYASGIDSGSISRMFDDIYMLIIDDPNTRIRLPAPVSDPDNRYKFMWPEGATISSRPASVATSKTGTSSKASFRGMFSNMRDSERLTGAMSVVSSSNFSNRRRHIGFIDEDDEETDTEYEAQRRRLSSSRRDSTGPTNTMRVNGGVVKPSASIEQMFAKTNINESETHQPGAHNPRATRSRPPAAVHKRNNNGDTYEVVDVEPLNTRSSSNRRRGATVGFGDD